MTPTDRRGSERRPGLLEIVKLSPAGDKPEPAVFDALERRTYGRDHSPGSPFPKPRNVERVLTLDSRWKGRIRYNLFARRGELDGEEIAAAAETELQLWLDEVYGLDVPIDRISSVVNVIAHRERYHPVRAYLDGLTWDGVPRVEGLLARYFGAADLPLYRRISVCWLVASIARILDPGCKVDTVVILTGEQGAGKSTAIRAMMPDPRWYSDASLDLDHKDALMKVHSGVWWYELGELADVQKKEVERVKTFISELSDALRPPYERRIVTWQRQVVFAGTTNAPRFLKDPTGSRRFWPVEIGRLDLAAIVADRDQLWAEALTLYRGGATWHLSREDAQEMQALSEDFQEEDSWEPLIVQWLEGRPHATFSIRDLFDGPLDVEVAQRHRAHENRVGLILRKLGCERAGRLPPSEGRAYLWRLPWEVTP